jgi:hypothetical protein
MTTLIEDFRIELREYPEGGKHLEFVSRSKGRLAHFPAWDHADRDLRHFTPGDVPFGSVDEPYEDADEAWRLSLYEDGGYVYVFEDDAPSGETFARSFRVDRDHYFAEWARIIHVYNPPRALDDVLGAPQLEDDDVADA